MNSSKIGFVVNNLRVCPVVMSEIHEEGILSFVTLNRTDTDHEIGTPSNVAYKVAL